MQVIDIITMIILPAIILLVLSCSLYQFVRKRQRTLNLEKYKYKSRFDLERQNTVNKRKSLIDKINAHNIIRKVSYKRKKGPARAFGDIPANLREIEKEQIPVRPMTNSTRPKNSNMSPAQIEAMKMRQSVRKKTSSPSQQAQKQRLHKSLSPDPNRSRKKVNIVNDPQLRAMKAKSVRPPKTGVSFISQHSNLNEPNKNAKPSKSTLKRTDVPDILRQVNAPKADKRPHLSTNLIQTPPIGIVSPSTPSPVPSFNRQLPVVTERHDPAAANIESVKENAVRKNSLQLTSIKILEQQSFRTSLPPVPKVNLSAYLDTDTINYKEHEILSFYFDDIPNLNGVTDQINSLSNTQEITPDIGPEYKQMAIDPTKKLPVLPEITPEEEMTLSVLKEFLPETTEFDLQLANDYNNAPLPQLRKSELFDDFNIEDDDQINSLLSNLTQSIQLPDNVTVTDDEVKQYAMI